MSIRGIDIGTAAMQRVDHGAGEPLTLDQAIERVAHLTDTKENLLPAVAYLACQVVGYRRSQNSDATLAMAQIHRIVRDYEERRR